MERNMEKVYILIPEEEFMMGSMFRIKSMEKVYTLMVMEGCTRDNTFKIKSRA